MVGEYLRGCGGEGGESQDWESGNKSGVWQHEKMGGDQLLFANNITVAADGKDKLQNLGPNLGVWERNMLNLEKQFKGISNRGVRGLRIKDS